MTIERFYQTLESIRNLDKELRLQVNLELIDASLTNIVASPAAPNFQSALAAALDDFAKAAKSLASLITPAQVAAIATIGGTEFFDLAIASKVQASVAANAMTPSVTKAYVQDLAKRRSEFLATVKQTSIGLKGLGVKSDSPETGTADVAFIVPRDLFQNQLGSFAKELGFFNKLIRDFSEAITGTPETVKLGSLSPSDPTITLGASVGVLLGIGKIVNSFLDAWKKIEEIRTLRGKLSELGLKGKAIEELTDRITSVVDEIVEESTQTTLSNYIGEDGRKNELTTAVRQDTRRLFAQIERGLVLQFRADSGPTDSGEETALRAIDEISRTLNFPISKDEPMLLTTGQILEGDFPEPEREPVLQGVRAPAKPRKTKDK